MARNSNLTHGMLTENQIDGLIAINQSYNSITTSENTTPKCEGLNFFQSLMIIAFYMVKNV